MVEFNGDWAALSGLVIIILLSLFVVIFLLIDIFGSKKLRTKN